MISLPEPDNANSVEADLTCELCFKSHQRRVFFISHQSLVLHLPISSSFSLSLITTCFVADNPPVGELLLRHRRRCQGPKKSTNRRKACDACVQAKAKCSYAQPACSRCAMRGAPCVYATSPPSLKQGGSKKTKRRHRCPRFRSPIFLL
jgi:hypothetical protein